MEKESNSKPKLIGAIAMLLLAGFFTFRFLNQDGGISEKAFYYDLSQQKIFVADRGLIPPILGIDGDQPDGVRAVVISTNATPQDKSSHVIAYLEMYAPELKATLEKAKASGTPPEIARSSAQGQRLVRRVSDKNWVSMLTPEGEKIVSEWAVPGANGITPVVCSP